MINHIHGVVSNLLTLARRENSAANLLDERPTRTLAINQLRHNKPIPIVGGVIQCMNDKIMLRRYKDDAMVSILGFETRLLISANYKRN